MTLKFGQNPTMREKMKIAEALLGDHTGASKGNHAPEEWKIKPTGKPWKGTIGLKATKKF